MSRCSALVTGVLLVSGLCTTACSSTPAQVYATYARRAEAFYVQYQAPLQALVREYRSARSVFLFADDGGGITLIERSAGDEVALFSVPADDSVLHRAYRRLGWSAAHVQRLTEHMRAARCSRIRCTGDFSQPMTVPPLELQCRIYPALYWWKLQEVYYDLFAENLNAESRRFLIQNLQTTRLGGIISPRAIWHYNPG
jgi:hypothetical protein